MRVAVNLVLLLVVVLQVMGCVRATSLVEKRDLQARDFFEEVLMQLIHQRRMFLDGFGNGTAAIERNFGFDEPTSIDVTAAAEAGEGRGRKKKLRQMNRTLMAIIMAYTLKFMFLIPTFVGTLILLKFTTALAGFFYALFAAVLGLEHHNHH
ncbi:uncharacterized protein LOC116417427 [Nasonia vitripennis]|uniref:Uncharacterized protein n=1 Tax=Nasonia vitripennis TaxID=7425 RepID=A0A7M7QIW9_NASVI|nr:uncharacterized protein LOC116417427 [Nasonia vitripennis]